MNPAALRAIRMKDGHSVRSLARASGISASYISQIESGLKEPKAGVAKRLAVALGVPLSSFFAFDDQSDGRRYAGDFPVEVPDAS